MFRKQFLFSLLLCVMALPVKAIDVIRPVEGQSAAMGNTSVCSANLWSVCNNPSGLCQLKGTNFGFAYQNLWMLSATAYKSAALAVNINNGVIALSANQLGDSNYNENKIGLAYARTFGPYFQMGLQLDYLSLCYDDIYENSQTFSFDIGFQSQLTEKLRLGLYLFNPVNAQFSHSKVNSLPIIARFGFSYLLTDDFLLQSEIEENTNMNNIVPRLGLEYCIFHSFYIRAGVQTNPALFTFGFAYVFNKLQVNVAAQMHQQLGASLQAGVILNFKSNRK